MTRDPDEAATNLLDPLVPRAIDLPTRVPLGDERLDDAAFDVAKILAAPDDPAEWPAWRDELARLAASARERLGLDDAAYEACGWASSCRVAAQIWLWDERLWDAEARAFTPERLLAAYADVGGLDGLVLWHAYPCIGIDERNQFDWYRVQGLRGLVDDLHAAGVRVFLDYNPWDVGTRREPRSDAEALRAIADELGADGVFLDTLKHADPAFISAMGGARPLALEGESRVPNERLADHVLSWSQWFADSEAPGVQRARLVQRKHMLHGVRRWNRGHADELQTAWMNGTGVLVWDAVFGVWVGWSARDRSTLRAMSRVQRACHEILERGDWAPLAATTAEQRALGVYGSTWRLDGMTLVTYVNRADAPRTIAPSVEGDWRVVAGARDGEGVRVPAHGIAGVLATHAVSRTSRRIDVAALERAAASDVHDPDDTFPARPVRVTDPGRSRGEAPVDAIRLPRGEHELEVEWRARETGLEGEAPYVEEWKPLPPRLHDVRRRTRVARIGAVAVARSEVTARELAAFQGAPAPESPDAPATLVDLDEARAYARHVGARLPTDDEWQLAAADARFERTRPLVWEWTEHEQRDGVTRATILKGGCEHRIEGSDWYADTGEQRPERSLRWLVTGIDASPSIGFRLAWDVPAGERDA